MIKTVFMAGNDSSVRAQPNGQLNLKIKEKPSAERLLRIRIFIRFLRSFREFDRRVVDTEIVLRGLIALPGGADKPFHGVRVRLRYTTTSLIAKAKMALSGCDFLFGGETIPFHRLLVILRHD